MRCTFAVGVTSKTMSKVSGGKSRSALGSVFSQSFRGGIAISPGTGFAISDKLELEPVPRVEQKATVRDRLTPKVSSRLTVRPKFSLQSGLELPIVRVRVQMEVWWLWGLSYR